MTQAANDGSSEHPAAWFIAALFGPGTEQPVFFQSLANNASDQDEARYKPRLLTRDFAPIERFVLRHDRARRGLFFCVATVGNGSSTRSKETVRETIGLHADIDFKSVVEDEPTIRARLDTLRCPATVRVRSGGGLHLYWLFRESVDTQVYMEPLEIALRALAEIIAGDPAVCEVSRLMRLPGTHNSKYGDMREVVCERLDGPRYELDELEEWLSEQQPVLTRKCRIGTGQIDAGPYTSEQTQNCGANAPFQIREQAENDNPWIAAAEKWGVPLRLDVDALLAAMGDGTIHNSLLRASASLISTGRNFEEVVAILMEASRRVAGPDWDWRKQEREIRGMCSSAQRKFPPKELIVSHEILDENIVNFDEARDRHGPTKPKPKAHSPKALWLPFAVTDGVVAELRQHGQDVLLSEGEIWLYGDGFWRIMNSSDQQWLLTEIQLGFEALGEPAKTAALNSSWKRINEHPRLFMAKVPWAGGDMTVCSNGMLQFKEGGQEMKFVFKPHSPTNYARRCINADYVEGAVCPRFEALLYDMLGRADLIDLVQEWLGAALSIGSLSREERRALLLVGPSRTGKTELAKIFALLFGSPIATPSVAAISNDRDRFALSSLYGAAAWIRDDAINEGDSLNPQRFKTIVTGEPIDIELKHKAIIRNYRCEFPVCLTCNSLPKTIDGSDAIFNRSLILRMEHVIEEEAATKVRTENGVRPGQSIGQAIFDAEAPGILNWALAGLSRLRARGFYSIPDSVKDAIARFRDDNNPIGEWVREAVTADPYSRVERRDLVRAYNGWQFEQEGEKAEARGGRWLLPKLRNQVPGLGEFKSSGFRYITGLRLTELGLAMWKAYGDANPHGGAGGSASVVIDVNRFHGKPESHARDAVSDVPF